MFSYHICGFDVSADSLLAKYLQIVRPMTLEITVNSKIARVTFTIYLSVAARQIIPAVAGIYKLHLAGKLGNQQTQRNAQITHASQPEGKRNGERKRPTFHLPRSRTICVQPDKYCHCLEGNLGTTAERRGRARTGLSERYDTTLS